FLFARDERDSVRARLLDRAVIDLAGEKPERQADHPARMGEHPLDRVMRLAGVGRPKQDRDTPRAVPRKRFGGRERNVHWLTGAEKDRACAGALERDAGGKPVSTFPRPALERPKASRAHSHDG